MAPSRASIEDAEPEPATDPAACPPGTNKPSLPKPLCILGAGGGGGGVGGVGGVGGAPGLATDEVAQAGPWAFTPILPANVQQQACPETHGGGRAPIGAVMSATTQALQAGSVWLQQAARQASSPGCPAATVLHVCVPWPTIPTSWPLMTGAV